MLHKGVTSFRDVFRIWFTWRRQASVCAATILTVVLIYALTARPSYTSSSRLILLPRTSEGVIITSGMDEKRVSPVTIEDINTGISIMKSDDVIRETVLTIRREKGSFSLDSPTARKKLRKKGAKAIDSLAVVEYLVEKLADAISIRNRPLSNLIEVNLTAGDPRVAAEILARYVDIVIRHHNRAYSFEQGALFLEAQADTLRRKLDSAEQRLSELQERYGIIDIELQNRDRLNDVSLLESQLKELELRADDVRMRIAHYESAIEQNQDDITLGDRPGVPTLLVELDKALMGLFMKRSEISANYTPDSREYQSIQRQIEKSYQQRMIEIGKALETERLELRAIESREVSLRKRIAERQTQIRDLNRKSQEISDLRRWAEIHQRNYMLYASKSEDARVFSEKADRNITNVRVIDRADVPLKRTSPKRGQMMLTALAIAFLAAVSIPFMLEAFDPRIKTPGDIEAVLGLPVLCTFLEMPGHARQHESEEFVDASR